MTGSKRVLVTGGAGMIGSNLVWELMKRGYDVDVIDNLSRGRRENVPSDRLYVHDLSSGTMPRALRQVSYDQVYHLAAVIGGVGKMLNSQVDSLINAAIDRTVLEFCVETNSPLLYCSTACVYRTDRQQEGMSDIWLDEDSALKDGAMPESVYGWCKLIGEISARRAHLEYNLKVSVVRMFNVYGRREFPELAECHVIPALIRKCLLGMSPLPVWGTGRAERSFLHAEDAARGIMLVAEKTVNGDPVNLGQPSRIKILDLAKLIIAHCGNPSLEVELEPEKPEGCFTRGPKIDRALALGWSPQVSLEAGIKDTVDWNRKIMSTIQL